MVNIYLQFAAFYVFVTYCVMPMLYCFSVCSSMDFSIYRDACDSVSDSDSDQDDLPDAVSFSESE